MAIVKDMQAILSDYETAYKGIWDTFNAASEQYKQQRMTGRVLDEKRKEKNEALSELFRTTNDAITDALTKYVDALPARYAKDPERVDANTLSMLNSAAAGVLELDGNDLVTLFDKFSGNLTMQGTISDFAEKHGIKAAITFYGEEQRKADAIDYAGGVRGCLSKSNDTNMLPLQFAYYAEGTKGVPSSLVGE